MYKPSTDFQLDFHTGLRALHTDISKWIKKPLHIALKVTIPPSGFWKWSLSSNIFFFFVWTSKMKLSFNGENNREGKSICSVFLNIWRTILVSIEANLNHGSTNSTNLFFSTLHSEGIAGFFGSWIHQMGKFTEDCFHCE